MAGGAGASEPPRRWPGPGTTPNFFGLLRTLCERDVEFVVIGGVAVGLHGLSRATKDIDIVPNVEAANMGRLWEALSAIRARPAEWDEFAPEELAVPFTREALTQEPGNWVLYTDLGRLDVMPYVEDDAGEIVYADLRSGAEVVELDEIGYPIWFASAKHMIAMKEHAARDVDLSDASALRMSYGLEDDAS